MDSESINKALESRVIDLSVFEYLDYAAWKGLVADELKGVPFEKKLISGTVEGIALQPLYSQEDSSNTTTAEISAYLQGLSCLREGPAKWKLLEEFPPEWPAGILLDLLPYVEAGASAVQELGIGLGMLVEYLREFENGGADHLLPGGSICWLSAAGSDFFMEIAKFRAIRVLFGLLAEECGFSGYTMELTIAARTARWNKTRLDPYVNMLRASSEAMSMLLGGCDAIYVGPFDESLKAPDEFSRRIARNVQILLREESHLDIVRDAGSGSWYLDTLSAELCQKAWRLFQSIEEKGGLSPAEKAGFVQAEVARSAGERKDAISKRKHVLVGASMYVNTKEEINWAVEPSQKGGKEGEASAAGTLKPFFAAAEYEDLRAAAERFKKSRGCAPGVFLMTMGPASQHKARADYCRDFLEPGGFEVIYPDGFDSPEAAVKAAVSSGASLCVVCSTDETYPELVPALASLMREYAPGMHLLIAGYIQIHAEAFKAAGVRDFIHIRANNAEMLHSLQKLVGVQG